MRLRSTSTKLASNEINLSYLQFENLAEKEFCNQCQFCARQGQWCGRRSISKTENLNPVAHANISDMDIGARKRQLELINAPWVNEPLIVNMATLATGEGNTIEEAPSEASVSSILFLASQ